MKKKFIAVILLIMMIGDFLLQPSFIIINALTTGEVYNYSLGIKENISDLKDLVSNKDETLYETDKAYKNSIDYLSEEIKTYENNLNEKEVLLDNGILLSDLINNYFSLKKTDYETYMPSDTTVIDVNNITDITYNDGVNDITLLTATEINDVIKNNYLKSINDNVDNLFTNFNTILNGHMTSYNNLITKIDDYILEIQGKKSDIKTFEENEKNILNNPNMLVNDTNIYTLIDNEINKLNLKKDEITISNIIEKENEINLIKNNALNLINEFYSNNKNYVDLELDTKIDEVENKYKNIDTLLNSWFTDISDYKNDNYSNYKDNLDITLINYYKDIINLESEYDNLIDTLNKYVERKTSDKENIDNLLLDLNSYRLYLNEEKVLEHITNLVELLKVEDEDTIDLLKNFLDINSLSNDVKEKIKLAKKSFYKLELNDLSYTLEIKDNTLYLGNVVGILTISDLSNILKYNANYSFTTTELTSDTRIKLYDRDDNLLNEYNIVIVGDVNNDYIVSTIDIEELKNNLLDDEYINTKKNRCDLNSDNKCDLVDLLELDKLVNKLEKDEMEVNATYRIERIEEDNYIYYNIYLVANGIVKGFMFDVNYSDNLKYNSYDIKSDGIIVKEDNNKLRLLGYDEYETGDLLLTIVFDKEEAKESYQNKVIINNIIVVGNNLEDFTIDNIINLYKKEIEIKEEINIEEEVEQIDYESSNEEIEEVVTLEEQEDKEEVEEKDKDKENLDLDEKAIEMEDEEIIWGNVIKIAALVLIATLIMYFLNKKDNEEDELDNM